MLYWLLEKQQMKQNQLPHNHGQDIEQKFDHMPSLEQFQVVSEVFKTINDINRLRIFWILCHCEECVINISALVDMSSPAISHHLKQLKASRLITSRRIGKEVYYKAADTNLVKHLHTIIEELAEVSCPSN